MYDANARLTNTSVVDVPRRADFSIDEEAVLARVAEGGIDYLVVTSPNNPTGQLASETFILRLLDATDALVMVDEAYFEFSRQTMRPYLAQHKNLVILRTFSKAFSLAGARMGYILGDAEVVREFVKVRQPYSVDAVSQAVARVVYANRAKFERGILAVIEERARLIEGLKRIPGVKPFPSDANYVLFRVENAPVIWEALYERGVLCARFLACGASGELPARDRGRPRGERRVFARAARCGDGQVRFEGSVDLTADGTSRRLRREASPRRGRLPVAPDLAARSRTRVPKHPRPGTSFEARFVLALPTISGTTETLADVAGPAIKKGQP